MCKRHYDLDDILHNSIVVCIIVAIVGFTLGLLLTVTFYTPPEYTLDIQSENGITFINGYEIQSKGMLGDKYIAWIKATDEHPYGGYFELMVRQWENLDVPIFPTFQQAIQEVR